MQCTLALIVAICLIGINVSEPSEATSSPSDNSNSPDNSGPPLTSGQSNPTKQLAAVKNEETESDKQIKQIQTNAAAVNPMNLISAVRSVNKKKLTESISSLKKLKQVLPKESDLATFINNLIYVFEQFRSGMIKSIAVSAPPSYFETLKKVGKELSGIAESSEESLAIFNAEKFDKITKVPFWNRSTFLVITGASQGLGKDLAIKFSALVKPDSTLVLLARNLQNLEATRTQILKTNPKLDVQIYSVDLSKADSKEFDKILKGAAASKRYELYFLVHNAGSLLTGVRAAAMHDIRQFNEYMTMNLYSVTALTSSFLKLFPQNERCIVNITSGAALNPLKGFAHYCVGKASREMFFRVLAAERSDVNVLNYSPGPMDTNLLRESAKNSLDEDTRKLLEKNLQSPVKIEDTIQKLTEVLEGRSYASGEHVSFLNLQKKN